MLYPIHSRAKEPRNLLRHSVLIEKLEFSRHCVRDRIQRCTLRRYHSDKIKILNILFPEWKPTTVPDYRPMLMWLRHDGLIFS